jgi:hypothetical protein
LFSGFLLSNLGCATPGRTPLIGSQALPPLSQPLVFALYGDIRREKTCERGQDFQSSQTGEIVVNAVMFGLGAPEVVIHRDPVSTAFSR